MLAIKFVYMNTLDWQSCEKINGLSNCAQMVGGRRPVWSEILP